MNAASVKRHAPASWLTREEIDAELEERRAELDDAADLLRRAGQALADPSALSDKTARDLVDEILDFGARR